MNRLLSHLPHLENPADLDGKILCAVRQAGRRRVQVRLGLAGFGLFSLVGWLGLSWSALATELQASSFFAFVQLAASDPDIVLSSTGQFAYGLLESLPVTALLTLLLGLFVLSGVMAILDGLRNGKTLGRFIHTLHY